MSLFVCLMGFLMTGTVIGCGGNGTGPEDTRHLHDPFKNIVVELKTDKKVYKVGEPVRFVLTVKNLGEERVVYWQPSSTEFDIVVKRHSETVWIKSMSEGTFPAEFAHALGPGEQKTFLAEWKQTIRNNTGTLPDPGVYSATGFLPIIVYKRDGTIANPAAAKISHDVRFVIE